MADTRAPKGGLITPDFAAPAVNPYGITDVGTKSNPTLVDIDGDGDLDLFVGNYVGEIWFFKNTGSATNPTFAAAVNNPYGLSYVGFLPSPEFADLNGDGLLDAIVGNISTTAQYFFNTGTAAAPAFAAPVGNPYFPSSTSRGAPVFKDINGDGLPDAFFGAVAPPTSSQTWVHMNTGTATAPAFAAYQVNPFGLSNISGAVGNLLTVADIDGDGDLDVVTGTFNHDIVVFTNTGSASSPAFAAQLVNPYNLVGAGNRPNPSFADIDGDGKVDAVVGADDGNLRVYLNIGAQLAPVNSTNANGFYAVGSVINLTVAFDEAVIVNTALGSPTLRLETGATDRDAVYTSGSGSKVLTFAYTVQAGDQTADLDQTGASALALNGATIQDAAGNNAVLTLAAPGIAGSLGVYKNIVIDTSAPTFTSATVNGKQLVLTYADVDQLDGAMPPPISAFTVQSGANTLAISAVQVNGANNTVVLVLASPVAVGQAVTVTYTDPTTSNDANALQDRSGNDAASLLSTVATNTMGDTTAPHGALLLGPPSFAGATANPYGLAGPGSFDKPAFVDIDGDGDLDALIGNLAGIQVQLNTGSASNPAFAGVVTNPYGIGGTFNRPRPSLADIDGDGDLDMLVGSINGQIQMQLNTGSSGAPAFAAAVPNPYGLTNVARDAAPSLVDIDGDGDLDALVGDENGNTLVQINTGSKTGPAFGAATANPYGLTNAGFFVNPSFVDIDGDGDLDALTGNANGDTVVQLNTGSAGAPAFAPAATNPYGLGNVGFSASPVFVDINGDGVLDAVIGRNNALLAVQLGTNARVAPVAADTASTPAGTYGVGSVIKLTVAFDEAVIVTGAPTLRLETGTTDRDAVYTTGSGSKVLTFTYTVRAGDVSSDLDQLGANALALNGGTMADAAGNNAVLTLAAPGTTGSLAFNSAIVVDGVSPTVLGVTSSTPDFSYRASQSVSVQVQFSEAVTVSGTPQLLLATGGAGRQVNYASGSGTDTLTFTYTVAAGNNSADLDYASAGALTLNGGTIQNAALFNARLGLPAPGSAGSLGANKALVIDTIAPNISINVPGPSPDTGLFSSDQVTKDTITSITGTTRNPMVADEFVQISVNGGAFVSAVSAVGSNSYTLANASLNEGSNTVQARSIDLAGNVGSGSVTTTVTVDTIAPTATINPAIVFASDTGISNSDFITSAATTTVSGTTTALGAGELVQISANGGSTWLNATGGANWTRANVPLSVTPVGGSNSLQLRISDVAGNTTAVVTQSYVRDNTAPVFSGAVVNANTLVLSYTEATTLDNINTPAAGAFAVKLGGAATAVNAVSVDAAAKTVTLTLATAAAFSQAVTVAYTDAPGDNALAIQDTAGNDAATMAATAATNNTPDPTPPPAPPAPPPPAPPAPPPPAPPPPPPPPDLDADKDGVPTVIENAVAELTPNRLRGDGNGDGLQDGAQADVASLSGLGASGYITLAAKASALQDVKVAAPPALPSALNLASVLSFRADVAAGGKETFSIYVDASSQANGSPNGFWVKNASGTWNNIATAIEQVGSKLKIDFAITDGGAFDADGLTNGVIDASGGAGQMPLSLIGLPADAPHGNFWF